MALKLRSFAEAIDAQPIRSDSELAVGAGNTCRNVFTVCLTRLALVLAGIGGYLENSCLHTAHNPASLAEARVGVGEILCGSLAATLVVYSAPLTLFFTREVPIHR